MARYDEATFELAKKLRAKAVQRLREEGFEADDRQPRGTPTFRSDNASTGDPGSREDAPADVTPPAPHSEKSETPDEGSPVQATVVHAGQWDVESGPAGLDSGSAFGLVSHGDYVDALHELKDFPGGRESRLPWFAGPILSDDRHHGRYRFYDDWVRRHDGIHVKYGTPDDPTILTVLVNLQGWHDDGQRAISRRAPRPTD